MARSKTSVALAAAAAALFTAAPASAAHLQGVAVTPDSELVSFAVAKPQAATTVGAIGGLLPGERVLGIDFRPANGSLVALTSASRLYTVNTTTAAATLLSTLSTPVSGDAFGIDFNPTVDRLRVVSDSGQNLRINVDTGATIVDGTLSYGPGSTPAIVGAAYTNNDTSPTTGTALFDIDTATDSLAQQTNPNAGTLATIGPLGVGTRSDVGFDVYSRLVDGAAVSNAAYASLGKGGTEKLYSIDLATGEATQIAPFGETEIADIAIELDQG